MPQNVPQGRIRRNRWLATQPPEGLQEVCILNIRPLHPEVRGARHRRRGCLQAGRPFMRS